MSSQRGSLERRRVPSQERAKVRVESILAATRELLHESGIASVTTARVAARAGVPVGSVYQYFPNKKAIFLALYEDYLAGVRRVVERFEAEASPEQDWQDFLARMRGALDHAEFDDDIEAILLATVRAFPELREYEQRHRELVIAAQVRVLRRLGSRWPRAKLRRLVIYAYLMNNARMYYRREFAPPRREITAWDREVTRAVWAQAFHD